MVVCQRPFVQQLLQCTSHRTSWGSHFHFTSCLTRTPHTLILPLFHHQPQFNFPCYTRKNLPSEAEWRLTGVIFRPLIDDIGGVGGAGNDVWSAIGIVHSMKCTDLMLRFSAQNLEFFLFIRRVLFFKGADVVSHLTITTVSHNVRFASFSPENVLAVDSRVPTDGLRRKRGREGCCETPPVWLVVSQSRL